MLGDLAVDALEDALGAAEPAARGPVSPRAA